MGPASDVFSDKAPELLSYLDMKTCEKCVSFGFDTMLYPPWSLVDQVVSQLGYLEHLGGLTL